MIRTSAAHAHGQYDGKKQGRYASAETLLGLEGGTFIPDTHDSGAHASWDYCPEALEEHLRVVRNDRSFPSEQFRKEERRCGRVLAVDGKPTRAKPDLPSVVHIGYPKKAMIEEVGGPNNLTEAALQTAEARVDYAWAVKRFIAPYKEACEEFFWQERAEGVVWAYFQTRNVPGHNGAVLQMAVVHAVRNLAREDKLLCASFRVKRPNGAPYCEVLQRRARRCTYAQTILYSVCGG